MNGYITRVADENRRHPAPRRHRLRPVQGGLQGGAPQGRAARAEGNAQRARPADARGNSSGSSTPPMPANGRTGLIGADPARNRRPGLRIRGPARRGCQPRGAHHRRRERQGRQTPRDPIPRRTRPPARHAHRQPARGTAVPQPAEGPWWRPHVHPPSGSVRWCARSRETPASPNASIPTCYAIPWRPACWRSACTSPTFRNSLDTRTSAPPASTPETSVAMLRRKFDRVTDPAGSDLLGAVRTRHGDVVGAFAADLLTADGHPFNTPADA